MYVAHALLRAASPLMGTQVLPATTGVHTSVNAARRSACATWLLYSDFYVAVRPAALKSAAAAHARRVVNRGI
jgi:hypothetical protein